MRIFFVEAENQYAIDLAREMVKLGHSISHVSSHFFQFSKKDLQKASPYATATIINSRELYRYETLHTSYGHFFAKLDIGIIRFFEPIERDAYILSDRWNYCPLSFRARKVHFRDLIRFWLGYLQHERIEAVYFPCTPHTVWELVLLQACKYLGIPACYLSHTAINNRSLLREWYGPMIPVPAEYLQGKHAEEILPMLPPELRKDFEEDSIVTNVIKAENDLFNKQKNLNSNLNELPEKITNSGAFYARRVRSFLAVLYYLVLSPWRRLFIHPLAMDERSNMLIWQYARLHHRRSVKKMKAFYESHARAINLDQNYVYFPLHLQPELTTQPEAQAFEDHMLALETIVQALPENWRVYVKENPRQYDVSLNEVAAESFRTIADMQDILALSDKIFLVPQNVKSADLIAKAKAVVVLTGTAGWESLTSGKPCIALAYPWYSPCKACIKVQTPEEMSEAFKQVQNISPEDVRRDLACYLHFYADNLFIGSLSDATNVGFNTRPVAELLKCHAQAFHLWLQSQVA